MRRGYNGLPDAALEDATQSELRDVLDRHTLRTTSWLPLEQLVAILDSTTPISTLQLAARTGGNDAQHQHLTATPPHRQRSRPSHPPTGGALLWRRPTPTKRVHQHHTPVRILDRPRRRLGTELPALIQQRRMAHEVGAELLGQPPRFPRRLRGHQLEMQSMAVHRHRGRKLWDTRRHAHSPRPPLLDPRRHADTPG